MNYNPYAQTQTNKPVQLGNVDKKRQEAANELQHAVGNASDILIRATAVFPLTLFPDTITIDRNKLTITHREFFKAAEVFSISIHDILNITATVGPFFGTIKIATRFFDPGKPYSVEHFKRADALRIKRIGQGYIIAKQQKIDTDSLKTEELAAMLDELGKVDPEERV